MELIVIAVSLCVILIVLGQPSSSREIENIELDEDEEREIVSPDYPNNFNLNLDYLLLVSTNRDRNIYVDFTEVLLRENIDFIYVGDGSVVDETTVYLDLTGRDPVSTSIVSPTDSIWIWFTSGGQGDILAERRFKFEIKETKRISLDDDSPAQITSREYPSDYPNDCHQLWFVSSPRGSRVQISFLAFAMEQEADYVTIGTHWEAAGDGDHVLVRYSGEFIPDDVVTPVGDVWIEMVTDRRKDDDGFMLTLESTKLEPTLYNYLPGFQTLNLISPNYPESDYPDDADLSWIVTCEPSFKLLIMIDELDTEAGSDILILGNGTDPDDYSTTLEEFSGRADGEGAFSISSETWLRFTTDGSVNYEGFSLQIYVVETGAELRRNITLDSEKQANIFSPDFPLDYSDNSDELWTISALTNHLILLHFEKFVLEDVQYDSLTIGTGRHPSEADSKVIGVYGGSVVPNDIQSASRYLWLQFVSDGSVSVQGFWIVVSANRIEAQTTVTPTTDAGSSTSKATETPPPGSTTSEAHSTMYPQPKSTPEGTLISTTNPTFLPTTNPTSSQSLNPSSTRGLAPSKTSEGSKMTSAKGSTLILTSPWSTVSEVPGSNAPRTGNKKVVVSTVIISLLVLVGLLLLVVLWLVQRSRNSPPLVDDGGKGLDEDDNLHHINPAYEYQTIDHIVLNSTHHSISNGNNSIKKPLPRPPTEISEEDDHRYSSYIDTTSEKMNSDLPMYLGSGGNENERDSGCDQSGIGIDEYHRYPHRGSNIGTGLDDLADIEYYVTSDFTAKSVDGQNDNEVYQEIPYDLETQEKQRSTDFGADNLKVCDLSNELLKVGCSDDPRRSSSNSDAIVASLIENDLYIPMKQESDGHIYDDTTVDMGIGDGAHNVAGGERGKEKWRKVSGAVDDELYDDTAPLDDTFYHIVTRNESDDEGVNEQIQTNPTLSDNCNPEEKWSKVSDAVGDQLYDDTAPLDDTFYHIVTRNESDNEDIDEQIQTNPKQPDNRNPANQIQYIQNSDSVEIPGNNDRVVCRIETVNDMDNDCDDASNENAEPEPVDDEAVDDPEYQIVDRNENDDEIGEEIDTHGLDVDDAIDAGIMSTVMVDNELYRPLSIVEGSGNLEEENQTFQNDTVI